VATVTRSRLSLSTVYVAVGCGLAAVYFAFPSGGTAQSTIYEGLGAAAVIAILWAVRMNRPQRRLPWILFALGNACFVVGDVIGLIQVDPPTPSAADVFYLAGYPLLAAGLLLLVIAAGGGTRVAALMDAAIVTAAFAIAQWVAVMGPAVRSSGRASSRASIPQWTSCCSRASSASSCHPPGERRRFDTSSLPSLHSWSATRSAVWPATRTRRAMPST
jgi:hypothetical protein